ncbi:MAG TPA: hypothetical protein VJN89_04070 [Candidatus Acidoferrum sp.]|nr:hypothetical protein [Candidatus Acidoferrum sp.]
MLQTGAKTQLEVSPDPLLEPQAAALEFDPELRARTVQSLRLLFEKRSLLAKSFLGGLAGGCLVAFLIPASYQASVQLMPPDNQTNSSLAMLAALTARTGGSAGAVAGDLLGIKSSGALFVGILRSRTVTDRLAARFDLRKFYSIRLEEDARTKLAENTAVSEDRKSGILSITVTDHDPTRAAAMAQAYVDELNQLVAQLSTSSAHRERIFLEERLRAVKQDLDDASRQFSEFASKNSAIDIKEQGRAMLQGAAAVEGELIASESELKGLEEIYTANNVRVRATRARIEELRRQLDNLGGRAVPPAAQSADSAFSQYPTLSKLPLLGVTYSDLYRRMQIQEAVYETLTQQYELAKVQEAKETPSVKVLDAASVPQKKSFPPRMLFTLLGGVLALGGAAASLLLHSRWQGLDASDPGKQLALEVFQSVNAHMPWATPNGSRVQALSHRAWRKFVRAKAPANPPGISQN